jgi:hypothetical protein
MFFLTEQALSVSLSENGIEFIKIDLSLLGNTPQDI